MLTLPSYTWLLETVSNCVILNLIFKQKRSFFSTKRHCLHSHNSGWRKTAQHFKDVQMYILMFFTVSQYITHYSTAHKLYGSSSSSPSSSSSSSSIGTTAHCGLRPVEQCPSIFSYLPPTLYIFSLPALEDLCLLPLSIFSGSSPFSRPFHFLSEDLFGHPILLHSL